MAVKMWRMRALIVVVSFHLGESRAFAQVRTIVGDKWRARQSSNLQPSAPEADALSN